MSKTVSIAAVCVGLLCTALCAYAYASGHPMVKDPDLMFWELAGTGVALLAIGVRGCLGQFDRNHTRTRDDTKSIGSASLCAHCDMPAVIHVTDVHSESGGPKGFHLCQNHAREYCSRLGPGTTWT
jgi:hypothetical protein